MFTTLMQTQRRAEIVYRTIFPKARRIIKTYLNFDNAVLARNHERNITREDSSRDNPRSSPPARYENLI